MKTIREKSDFRLRCIQLLAQMGGQRVQGHWCVAFTLETEAGTLLCSPMEGWLATRFENIDQACALLNPGQECANRLNPTSGKWNFHFTDEMTVAGALDFIRAELGAVATLEVES